MKRGKWGLSWLWNRIKVSSTPPIVVQRKWKFYMSMNELLSLFFHYNQFYPKYVMVQRVRKGNTSWLLLDRESQTLLSGIIRTDFWNVWYDFWIKSTWVQSWKGWIDLWIWNCFKGQNWLKSWGVERKLPSLKFKQGLTCSSHFS